MTTIRLFLKKLLPDIRFWIFLFFVVRLYGIWLPPIDSAQSWRQVTGNMAARNFIENDANPTDIYFTKHKGWSMENDEFGNFQIQDSLHNLGCRWILINKKYENSPIFIPENVAFSDENFDIIRLQK